MKKLNQCSRGIVSIAVLSLISIVLISLFAGCGAPYPKNPDQVLIEFSKAIAEGDMKKAESFCSSKFKSSSDFAQAKQMMSNMPKVSERSEMTAEQKKEMDEFTSSMSTDLYDFSIDGSTAKVWIKDMTFMKYVLVKEGGKWKLDNVEMDQTEMLKGLGNMLGGGK